MKSKDIDREVEFLRKKYLNFLPPFNPYVLGRRLGIKIFNYTFPEEISGLMVILKGKPFIGINRKFNSYLKRYITAHEIGHFVLHKASFYLCGKKGDEEEEIEANYFAAELLLPLEIVLRDIDFHKNNFKEIVKKYLVPEDLVKNRLKLILPNLI